MTLIANVTEALERIKSGQGDSLDYQTISEYIEALERTNESLRVQVDDLTELLG